MSTPTMNDDDTTSTNDDSRTDAIAALIVIVCVLLGFVHFASGGLLDLLGF